VGFTMDGTELGLVLTDAEGVARTGYIVPEGAGVGERVIGAEYAGDEVYDRSSGTGALTVLRTDTRAYVPDLMRTGSVGLDVVLRGYLYRATDRAGVMGRTMTFTVDGTPAGSAVTIDTGRATAYYTLPAESESGIVVVRAEFAGDATYGASADEGLLTLTVQRLSTIMWVLPRIVLPDTNTYLRAYLRRTSDYSWLPDKPVAISLDGTEVGTALTDSGGRASILYHVPADYQTGEHTITATFAGDDEFFGSTADGWMLVL
ncbi:MAG: Ig-like domain repeat protein, partial [Armatimonadetes bacterium]|nr:Ig-like domain repeat protein [Armatimonadota bacterium]